MDGEVDSIDKIFPLDVNTATHRLGGLECLDGFGFVIGYNPQTVEDDWRDTNRVRAEVDTLPIPREGYTPCPTVPYDWVIIHRKDTDPYQNPCAYLFPKIGAVNIECIDTNFKPIISEIQKKYASHDIETIIVP